MWKLCLSAIIYPQKLEEDYIENRKLVCSMRKLHRDELMQNWELVKDSKPLNRIAPLV